LQGRYFLDPSLAGRYGKKDVLFAIECFEHIPDADLQDLMPKIRTHVEPRSIVFSSTPHRSDVPGWDVQWGHINLKAESEWHAFFAGFGYVPASLRPPVTSWATLYVDVRQGGDPLAVQSGA